MPHISLNDPIVGDPDSTEEPKIPADFDIIANVINGNLDSTNLASSFVNGLLQFPNSSSVHQVAFGIFTFTGNGNFYQNVTVPHGLTVRPNLVLAMSVGFGLAAWAGIIYENQAPDTTNLYFVPVGMVAQGGNGSAITASGFANGTQYQFYWLAIT